MDDLMLHSIGSIFRSSGVNWTVLQSGTVCLNWRHPVQQSLGRHVQGSTHYLEVMTCKMDEW